MMMMMMRRRSSESWVDNGGARAVFRRGNESARTRPSQLGTRENSIIGVGGSLDHRPTCAGPPWIKLIHA